MVWIFFLAGRSKKVNFQLQVYSWWFFDYRALAWERESKQAKRAFGPQCISDTYKKRGKEGEMLARD